MITTIRAFSSEEFDKKINQIINNPKYTILWDTYRAVNWGSSDSFNYFILVKQNSN